MDEDVNSKKCYKYWSACKKVIGYYEHKLAMCLDFCNKCHHTHLLSDDNKKNHNEAKECFNDDDDFRKTQRNEMKNASLLDASRLNL